jgi:PAS domain S-box-containing protein
MKTKLKILFVEDVPEDAELVKREIKKSGFEFVDKIVETKKDYTDAIQTFKPDIILSDYSLPNFDGMQALQIRQKDAPLIPFILVTGSLNEETAVDIMKAGADDYIIKQNLTRLGPAIKSTLEKKQIIEDKIKAEEALKKSEERYRRISSTISDISYSCETDENGSYAISWITGALENITGYTLDEIKALRCWGKIVIEEDFNIFEINITGLVPDTSSVCELRIRHKNGKIVWLQSFAECVRLQDKLKCNLIYGGLVNITGRKLAEEALSKNEKQLSNALDIAHLGPWEYEVSTDEFTFNDHFYKIFRVTAEDMGGYKMSSSEYAKRFVHPEDAELVGIETLKAIETNDPNFSRTLEHRIIYGDGELGYILVKFFIVKDSSGRTIKTYGVNQDITERKQAEEELLESETRLSTIFDNDPTGIFIVNEKTRMIYDVNNSALDIIGLPKEDVVGKICHKFLCPAEIGSCPICDLGQMVDRSERMLLKSDGTNLPILKTVVPIKLKGVNYLLESFIDISERKKAEEMLKASEEKYQSIFESTGTATMIIEEDTSISMVNNECFQLTGYSAEELIFTKWTNYVTPESLVEMMKYHNLRREEPGKAPKKYEVKLIRKNGEVREAMLDVGMIPGTKQSIVSILDITDRKQAEEELFQSRNDWENTFDTITDMITIHDSDYNIIRANKAAKTYLGLPELDKIFKTKCFRLYHGTENPPIECPSCDCLKTGLPGIFELFEPHLNLHLEIRAIPRFDINNQLIGLVHVVRDITERKKAEESIRESEVKFNTSFKNSPVSIAITALISEKFIDVNEKFVQDSGYMREELIGYSMAELGFYIDISDREKLNAERHKKGNLFNYNISFCKKSGEILDCLLSASTILLYGEPCLLTSIVDITENKKAETNLKKSEEKFRSLVENMPEGFYQSTPEGRFLDVNPAFIKMLGYNSKEELLKVNIPTDLYIEEEERTLNVSYNTEFTDEFEVYRLRRKDGTEIWLEDFCRYILDEKGKVIIHEGICRDITLRKQADDEMIKAKELAEESNRLKSSFLANMSHELRTPMVGILGFSEIIQFDAKNEELKEMAGLLNSSANRLMDTLNLILDISRIESGELKVAYEYIDIIKVVKESVNLFEPQAGKKNLYLEFISEENSFVSRLDERLVRQIANNLINNAIKFTEKGGVTVQISKAKSDGMEYSILKIKDTGIGIPEKFLKIIFEEFRQVSEGHNRSYEGTGLGLSITKKFVDTLKGEISVESELESGTTFTVKFPVEPDVFSPKIKSICKPGEENINVEPISSEKKQKKNITILCIDDDKDSLFFAKKYLTGICVVDLADNGIEAIRLAKKKKYPLIIMDINLKMGMNGVEITREIRKIKGYEKTPVIAVTAYAMKGDREKYLGLGFDEYLSKPYKAYDIISVVKKTIYLTQI